MSKIFRFIIIRLIGIIENITYFPFINIIKLRTYLYGLVLKKIGKNCAISENVKINFPQNLSLGSRVSIHRGVYINALSAINIGDNSGIANNSTLSGGEHIHKSTNIPMKEQGMAFEPIYIGKDVLIANNCVITAGSTINDGCYVGALTLVNGNIPKFSVLIGNPCRILYNRKKI
tara:strand:- start:1340 stop:1864 length:525 start_codon:yes stop_codon:yes gene_type:complete